MNSRPLLGTVSGFPPNFEPKGWLACDGRMMSIQEHAALFSILGTTFGGDGVRTFALPKIKSQPSESGAAVNLYIAVEGFYPSRA